MCLLVTIAHLHLAHTACSESSRDSGKRRRSPRRLEPVLWYGGNQHDSH